MRTRVPWNWAALLLALGVLIAAGQPVRAAEMSLADTEISGGAAALGFRVPAPANLGPYYKSSAPDGVPGIASYVPGTAFTGFGFDDNAAENGGFLFIPPDPMGAAGTDRVIGVVNTMIEARNKLGALLWRDGLSGFFAGAAGVGAGTLGTFTFDPKVIYDHHAGRFVVVTLELTQVLAGGAANASRILIAVSKTATPATATGADWWYWSINSSIVVGAIGLWADYPGLEVDEEVIYITANMFNFAGMAGAFDQRLWIVHKGLAGGLYAGGAAVVTIHSPYDATGVAGFKTTTMPAEVHGAPGVGTGIGTYLVSYSGLTFGGPGGLEAILVIRVNNPTAAVSFTQEFVTVGDLEDVGGVFGFPPLPDAPQSGTAQLIEVNDQRALDAVWRGNSLWLTTTVNPNAANSPPNVGQATAQWIRLNTAAVVGPGSAAGLVLAGDRGVIGGEDITPGPEPVTTFFPSVAVNSLNEAKFGFAASASSIFCGAYVAGRKPADAAGTVRASATVAAGTDFYIRTFDGPPCNTTAARNRWGDYSGISIDPVDDRIFWVNNERAIARGTPTTGGCNGRPDPEDGRWGTAWASCAFPCVAVTCAPDLIVGNGGGAGSNFSFQVCFTNCGALATTYDFTVGDTQGWCGGSMGSVVLAPGASHCITVACAVPGATPSGTMNLVTLTATPQGCPQDAKTCSTKMTVDGTVPVAIEGFEAISGADGVQLTWRLGANWREELLGVRLQRADVVEGPYADIAVDLAPAAEMTYRDASVESGRDYWYRLVTQDVDGAALAGPIRVTTSGALLRTQLFAPYEVANGGLVQVRYSLAGSAQQTRLEIFDVRGRRVTLLDSGLRQGGTYLKTWNRLDDTGSPVARGVYFINLTAGGERYSEKLVLLQR